MSALPFLILFPFLAALGLLVIPNDRSRRILGFLSAIVIYGVSVYLLSSNLVSPARYYTMNSGLVGEVMLAVELLMAVYIAYMSLRFRKYYPLALTLVQTAILLYLELGVGAEGASAGLFMDRLSLIMAFVIGIIGTLICVYAFGYMGKFHESHKEVKDRRGLFYFVLFAFLGAMFGLVFSDNILWIYFFWEVTTICSFILIGYTQTHEAVNNAFHALTLNLVGGLAFAIAILYLGTLSHPVLTLEGILKADKAIILLPAILIGFAGLTKSAQLPFSSWLVGAMVAPTPVSALLHSSTMVKAGVYILIRFAPVYQGNIAGTMLSLVGGVTFLLTSAIAVSQSNAKKVLAYSTIANLGLIVACAGVGTYEAVWAAILLIIFHALAKSLMFLCVGTVEQRIQSKDIEDMEGLIMRMPKVTVMMLIGIAGMFLAPFGMLISKWATLKAFIDSNPLLLGMVAFGSGITVLFWSKWMGKIIAVKRLQKTIEGQIDVDEWVALYTLTGLTIGMCFLFPLVSNYFIEPFVLDIYGMSTHLSQDNIMIMFFMLAGILMMPLSLLYYKTERKHLTPYMSGRTTVNARFLGTAGVQKDLSLKNYYMDELFGEKDLLKAGVSLCILLIGIMLVFSLPHGAGVPI